jgi:acyl carrier protein
MPGVVEETAQIDQVRQWLVEKKPEVAGQEIDLDLDLIENRVIDSLIFVDLLFFLEEITGRDLQEAASSANAFRTLRTIQTEILEGG